MNKKQRSILIWGISLLSIGLYLYGAINSGFQTDLMLFLPIVLTYVTLGSLIAARNPENAIGWIYIAGFFILSLNQALIWYATSGLQIDPGSLPAADVVAAFTGVLDYIGYELFIIIPFFIFPDGHLLSRRWKPILWFAVFAVVLQGMAIFRLGPLENYPGWDNPLGIDQLAGYFKYSATINNLLIAALFIIGPFSLFLRYRRASAIERQQIKWFAYSGIIGSMGMILLLVFSEGIPPWLEFVIVIPFLISMPIAIAIAIFRYRLWDIDIIIRRTLQYTLLTGLLALIYFGSVVLLENLVGSLTGRQSPLVIVISTLVIAALFNPLRTRIQDFIDRRFYRQKYDAEQALAKFAFAARDEMDVDRLTASLLNVVEETIQPESTSLWILTDNDR
jgi:hypothetical protein